MGAKGQSSHRDPPFLPWGRKEESRGAIVRGKRPGSQCQYLHWAQGPSPRKNPSSVMGRTLLDHGYSQGQRKQPNTSNDTSGHSMEREEYENRKGQWRKWKCLGEELPLLHSVPYT